MFFSFLFLLLYFFFFFELGFDFMVSVFCLVLEFRLHLDVCVARKMCFFVCSYQSMLDFFPFWGISNIEFGTGKV